ncbi:hypothetical protein NW762_005799 [Fusarium torreyae]|uniref:Uncharacterized protein n=1 Tax=Fusarium torreyae TaxID=1237075 RepID=A0A9W8VFP6_9HYPO|nr:hypothetical protein NW762_005799 [Fusarium torreyae]
MAQNPYYGGNHPPPLFVAELDSQPGRPGDTPSHHGPDGAPVFEMSSEPVLPQHNQDADQWPSPLQTPGMSKPPQQQQDEAKDKPAKEPSATTPSVMANPWAYFGPESPENTTKQEQRPQIDGRRPSEPVYKPYPGNSEPAPEVPHGTRPPANTSSPDPNDDIAFYPAPLKLAHRPANAISPPGFKPYAPPVSQDAQDLQPKPLSHLGRTDSQSTTASNSYRPYRPHSPHPPAAPAVSSFNVPSATTSPLQNAPLASPPAASQQQPVGAAPHQPYSPPPANQPVNPPASDNSLSPKPTASLPTSPGPQTQPQPQSQPQPQPQHGIPNAAPAQPVPSSASTYLPSPMTPSAHPTSMAATSPATPALNAGVPFVQPHYAAQVSAPNYAQSPAPGATSPPLAASSHNAGVPFAQPQYATPIQAHNYGQNQSTISPSTSTAVPSQAPVHTAPTPAYNSSQPTPAQSGYSIPQPTYAPAHTPVPASSTLGGMNQPAPHPPAPYQQASHSGPERPYPQHSNTEPYPTPAPTMIPQSPPPPYAPQDIGPSLGAQAPAAGNPMQYQPPSAGPYPPQPQYPSQPAYAPTTNPPSQGQPSYGLQPPALPPRPSSSQGFAPTSGFGAGPADYNPANYPRPPQTYFSPPPALPPRPGAGKLTGGGGRIFGSSSADKWLRKTGQVLENTLAPYLQGQSGPNRPGSYGYSHQGQQASGPYPPQGQHYHAPHLAPQFRGAPESQPPPGPGAPGH